ncbi:hypothetical protein E4T56_gene7536, partial [Termitomyces sp. T112]
IVGVGIDRPGPVGVVLGIFAGRDQTQVEIKADILAQRGLHALNQNVAVVADIGLGIAHFDRQTLAVLGAKALGIATGADKRLVVGGIGRTDDRPGSRHGAEIDLLDDRLEIETVAQRAPHANVIGGRPGVVDVERERRAGTGRAGEQLEAGLFRKERRIGRLHALDQIHLPRRQRARPHGVFGQKPE